MNATYFSIYVHARLYLRVYLRDDGGGGLQRPRAAKTWIIHQTRDSVHVPCNVRLFIFFVSQTPLSQIDRGARKSPASSSPRATTLKTDTRESRALESTAPVSPSTRDQLVDGISCFEQGSGEKMSFSDIF